jgi:tetratricopeptide (TPR) repeat protein
MQVSNRFTSSMPLCRAPRVVRAALVATIALVGFGRASAQSDVAAMWKDPAFQKQFVGGYGINSEIEPRVTPDEVKILEKIGPLMGEDLPQAESVLRKAMKPGCSAILDFNLASIQAQQERMSEALANYQKAVDKFPSFRRAWRAMGLLLSREGKHDAAISAFTRMIELGGGDGYSYGLLGIAYAAKQDYQAAEASFRSALLLQPENSEWRFRLVQCAFKQDKFEDAATLLNVLIERYPDKAQFWLLQAETYLGMKQPLKAAENLEAMDLLGKGTVDSLYMLGDIYVSESLMDLAVRAYRRAIGLGVHQPIARPLRAAEVMLARGGVSQAREITTNIHASFDPTMEDADRRKLLKLEARLSMAEGAGSAEMAAVLEEIVKLDPLDGEALCLLGQHYSKQGEPDRAIFYYERAASIEGFEVKAKIYHAQVLVSMGRYSDALPLLRRAQEVKPREDIARYLESVERIAKSKR